MTPPPAAAALAALTEAVHAAHCGKPHPLTEHSETQRTFAKMEAESMASALAASGWRLTTGNDEDYRVGYRDGQAAVTREGEGLPSPVDATRMAELLEVAAGMFRAYALASGEEGQ